MKEKIVMRLEVLGAETLAALDKCFRRKVQLEEDTEENNVKLHFARGMLEAFTCAQKAVKEILEGEKLEERFDKEIERQRQQQ